MAGSITIGTEATTHPTEATAGGGGGTPVFPALPASPALPDYGLRIIDRGAGRINRSERLLDFWRAQGRPVSLGFIVSGAAAASCGGISRSGSSSKYAIVAATNLSETEDGRLLGRFGIARATLPAATLTLTPGKWYPRGDFLSAGMGTNGIRTRVRAVALTMRSAAGEDVNFSYRAGGNFGSGTTSGDDTTIIWGKSPTFAGSIAGKVVYVEGFPFPPVVRGSFPVPFAAEDGVQFLFRAEIANPDIAIYTSGWIDRLLYALRKSVLSLQEINAAMLSLLPMDWPNGALAFARDGDWVRRSSWSDPLRQMRFEAGAGDARAVFVVESSTEARRVVRNSDFAQADYEATDWLRLAVSGGALDLDLTKARLAAVGNASTEWILFASTATAPAPPGVTPDPPDTGTYVLVAQNGVQTWVPTAPFACPL